MSVRDLLVKIHGPDSDQRKSLHTGTSRLWNGQSDGYSESMRQSPSRSHRAPSLAQRRMSAVEANLLGHVSTTGGTSEARSFEAAPAAHSPLRGGASHETEEDPFTD